MKKKEEKVMAMNDKVASFLKNENIKVLKEKLNVVLIKTDRSCQMAEVSVNGKTIMLGNEWDFHNGCHGMDLPTFRGKVSLANIFDEFFKSLGYQSEIKLDNTWKFE